METTWSHLEPCRLTERPFAEFAKLYPGHFICEPKYDGERVLVSVSPDEVDLAKWAGERLGKVSVTNRYGTTYDFSFLPDYEGEIRQAVAGLPKPLILDAEFVSMNNPDLYGFLKDRVNAIKDTQLIIFDLLQVNGQDIRADPLTKRKKMLLSLQPTKRVQQVTFAVKSNMDEVWEYYRNMVRAKFEGIVVKPASSIYTDGAWCKLKMTVTHDVVILAIKKTSTWTLRKEARSFMIGFVDEEGKILEYGNVSSGYQNVPSDQLRLTGKEDDEYLYVEPSVVIEIMAHSLLETHKFREPRILRTRTDKRAVDCKIPDGH